MLVRPSVLSLITTHQCTAACDNCCFACTPKVTKAIPPERLRTLIDEAAQLRTMKIVVFTGGECFLLGRDLDDLIARAAGYGLATRCVTNGYWGTSPRVARARVARLVEAGLIEINFSTGPMHAKWVPVERIAYAAAAAVEAGLTTLINVETYEDCGFDLTAFLSHPALADHVVSGKLMIQRNVWIDNAEGMGSRHMTHIPEHSRFRPGKKTPCTTLLNVIAVTPDQKLIACCGLNLESIPELCLGSIADHSIQEVLASAPDDLLKLWIHLDGPEVILEFVKKHAPGYVLPVEAVHPCETCHKLYADPLVQDVLRAHSHEVEEDLTDRYLTTLAMAELTTATWHIKNTDTAAMMLEEAAHA